MRTYQNPLQLPGQHKTIGAGDPFVFRHNGRYYLLPSPSADSGILLWRSVDMAEWEFVGNLAQDKGFENVYAPEMFYYNGTFYLMGSPRGEGHYLYTAPTPEGPFTRLRDDVGFVIDGSMFADDDGSLYFTHAEYPAIHGHHMLPDGTMDEGAELFGTSMGHWTEGPGIFKRGGKYYITMTGNHLLSRGYRINYAVSNKGPLGPYQVPRNKTLLVNTIHEYGSLGHSSNVIGPDLDSYWIFYHSFLIEQGGKLRTGVRRGRFTHMDRMFFNGDELHVDGPTLAPALAPQMPDSFGWADDDKTFGHFTREGGLVLLAGTMGDSGTAEVNLVPGDDGAALFAFDEDGDCLAVSLAGGMLRVARHSGGGETVLLEKPMFDGFRTDVLHTVRLEADRGNALVLVDGMQQGYVACGTVAGRVGTKNAARTSFVAFTKHVNQSSDRAHHYQLPAFLAGLCALPPKDGTFPEGTVIACEDGEKRLLLGAGEGLRYRVNAPRAGRYQVQATLQALQPGGACCRFDSGQSLAVVLPVMEGLKRMPLGTVELQEGLQEWSFTLEEGALQLRGFDIFPAEEAESGDYKGLDLCYQATQMEGEVLVDRMIGLEMDRPGQGLAKFGRRFHCDGFIEAELLFRGEDMEKSAGLFLRVSEDSAHQYQVEAGYRGYYIGFSGAEVFIWRMDFDKTVLMAQRCKLLPGQPCRIKAVMEGNKISAYVDDLLVAEAVDPDSLPYGVAAVGTFGSRVTISRVNYHLD